jgi:hypothetical protein
LANKVYEYGELYSADVALIIYQKARYYTYASVDNPCFLPCKKEIVGSLWTLMKFTKYRQDEFISSPYKYGTT